MLMSATLGSVARNRWVGGDLPGVEVCATLPYPAIWTGAEMAPKAVAGASRPKTVRVDGLSDWGPEVLAAASIEAARAGARVLVVRNQVDNAIACWQAVHDAGKAELLMAVSGRSALHHSRYAVEDRAALDAVVQDVLTTNPAKAPCGAIVIGTQTLEQSLDIDADLLITDLCPIDVLLQRIGRLHRHDLPRPRGFTNARCLVAMPAGGLDRFSRPAFENGLDAWESAGAFLGVYTNLASVELTRRLIAQHSVWEIPAMNRALVEGATHPDRVAALLAEKGPDWRAYHHQFSGAELVARQLGRNYVLRRDELFVGLELPGNDERVMTRLGDAGPVVRLQSGAVGAFDTPVTQLALPAHWASEGAPQEGVLLGYKGGMRLTIGERSFLYGVAGLQKELDDG